MRRQYCYQVLVWRQIDPSHPDTYLRLDIDGTETVEQLKRSEHMALDENGGGHGSSSPPSRARRHLIEPLFQRKLPWLAAVVPPDSSHCVGSSVGLRSDH